MQTDWGNFPSTLLLWVTESILGGLVVSHIALWMAHMKYKLHVSETYVNKVENMKTDRAIDDIQKTLKDILAIVHELKGRAAGHEK
jgi:hypothetical protein